MVNLLKKIFHSVYKFSKKNYNLLLVFLILLFVVRPYNQFGFYIGLWKLFFVSTVIFSVFNVEHSRVVRWIVSLLAVPSIFFNWLESFHASRMAILGLGASTVLFLGVCAASILKDVILRARVTLETLRGAVCAYFLVGFLFSYFYLLAEAIIPGTMLIRGEIKTVFPGFFIFLSKMIYFSFVTLLTVGYGDIVAAKDFGQTAVVLEAVFGQLYVAILVARLVAVYSFITEKDLLLKTSINNEKINKHKTEKTN